MKTPHYGRLFLELKTEPKVESWYPKLGRAGTAEIWQESDLTLGPHHIFIPWTRTQL